MTCAYGSCERKTHSHGVCPSHLTATLAAGRRAKRRAREIARLTKAQERMAELIRERYGR